MRKFFLFTGILASFFVLGSLPVRSQDIGYSDAYAQYLQKLDVYRKEYSNFTASRDFYLKSSTLTLKEKVRLETYDLLVARDDLLGVYMKAIRARLQETPDHPGNEKGNVIAALREDEHKGTFDRQNDSLETLLAKGEESRERYDEICKPIIYEALSTLSFSRFLDLKIRHENIYKAERAQIDKLEGQKRTLFDRWTDDIDKEFSEITKVEVKAREIRVGFSDTSKRKNPKAIYDDFIDNLGEGRESFERLNGFVGEVFTTLKS
jgi:hypothetical protein